MAIPSKVAPPENWSPLAMALAVSVPVGCVLIYFNHKKLSTLTKNTIEQTRRVLGLRCRQMDFGHEKVHYFKLEGGQVDQGQTNQVNNASSVPWSAPNHQQSFSSIGVDDGQRDQLSAARTSKSLRGSQAESETSRSSLVAGLDGKSGLQGTTSFVSDNSMLVCTSTVNEPTKTQEPINNAGNRRDKGKNGTKQNYQVEGDGEQKGPQLEEEGEGRDETSGLQCVDPRCLGRLEEADCCAVDDTLRWIGSQHGLLTNGDAQTKLSRELTELSQGPSTNTGEAQGEHESLIMPEIADTGSGVTLWRLAANRRALTEEMVDMILNVATHET